MENTLVWSNDLFMDFEREMCKEKKLIFSKSKLNPVRSREKANSNG